MSNKKIVYNGWLEKEHYPENKIELRVTIIGSVPKKNIQTSAPAPYITPMTADIQLFKLYMNMIINNDKCYCEHCEKVRNGEEKNRELRRIEDLEEFELSWSGVIPERIRRMRQEFEKKYKNIK